MIQYSTLSNCTNLEIVKLLKVHFVDFDGTDIHAQTSHEGLFYCHQEARNMELMLDR